MIGFYLIACSLIFLIFCLIIVKTGNKNKKNSDIEKYKICFEPNVKKRRRIMLIICIIIFVFIFIPLESFFMGKYTNCSEVIDGVITRRSSGSYKNLTPPNVEASYEVDGKEYIARGYIRYKVTGDSIKVHYNKDNPSDSYVGFPEYENWWYNIYEVVGSIDILIIFFIIFFELFLHFKVKNKLFKKTR